MNYSSQHSVQFKLATLDSFLKKLERTYKIITMIWSNKLIIYTPQAKQKPGNQPFDLPKNMFVCTWKDSSIRGEEAPSRDEWDAIRGLGGDPLKMHLQKARWYYNDMKLCIYIYILST